MDGHWLDWTPWTQCSASCDQGVSFRQRTCVAQSGNGRPCSGQAKQHDFCTILECPAGNAAQSNLPLSLIYEWLHFSLRTRNQDECVEETRRAVAD